MILFKKNKLNITLEVQIVEANIKATAQLWQAQQKMLKQRESDSFGKSSYRKAQLQLY